MSEYIIDWDENLVIDTFSKNSLRGKIVRCRDCEYYIDSLIFYNPFCSLMNDRDTEPDGFCAWGERK